MAKHSPVDIAAGSVPLFVSPLLSLQYAATVKKTTLADNAIRWVGWVRLVGGEGVVAGGCVCWVGVVGHTRYAFSRSKWHLSDAGRREAVVCNVTVDRKELMEVLDTLRHLPRGPELELWGLLLAPPYPKRWEGVGWLVLLLGVPPELCM